MKVKFITSILVLSLTMLFVSSCDNNDPSPNSRKFGGTLTLNFGEEVISVSKNSIYVHQGILSYETEDKVSNGFKIMIEHGIAETTYALGSFENTSLSFRGYHATEGHLAITEIDEQTKTISGTFQATMRQYGFDDNVLDEKDITNGVFTDVPYVIQDEGTGNTVFAKIDGKEFRGAIGTTMAGFYMDFDSGYKILTLSFPDSGSLTSYDVADFEEYHYVKYIDGLYTYKAVSGTITVTAHDVEAKHVEGTYNAILESTPVPGTTISITEGSFSLTYP